MSSIGIPGLVAIDGSTVLPVMRFKELQDYKIALNREWDGYRVKFKRRALPLTAAEDTPADAIWPNPQMI